ncbi:MAG: hypothetical protein ABEJ02_02715 [Candidatus Paceibacteria bacterium]
MKLINYHTTMKVEKCKSKDNWNKNLDQNCSRFLQSWEWGEFKRSLGKDVYRLQLKDNGKLKAQAQGIKHELGAGFSYLYFPRVKPSAVKAELLEEISNLADFARIEPTDEISDELDFKVHSSHSRQPI